MPNTDETSGWLRLLKSLTDEELQRYGGIADDQRRLEWQYGWAQVVLAAAALAALGWFVYECVNTGLSWRVMAILGLAVVLGYWPYRRAVVRRLWDRHSKAVAREAAARRRWRGGRREG